MGNLDTVIRRDRKGSYPWCGRLIVMEALDSQKPLQAFSLENNFSIDFPAMPDSIELARQTDYKVVSNMVVPDGVHLYRYTAPLQIPFTFSLHAMDDEYCPKGALTLLQVASRLHALVLPFGDSESTFVTVGNDAPMQDNRPQPGQKSPGNDANQQAKSSETNDPTFQVTDNSKFDPPVTCRLELMFTSEKEPGIICTGYVKDVRVVLKGPWLKGPDRAFNLPSSGDFSFTFMHRPAHYNAFSSRKSVNSSLQSQAFSQYVLERFYNTRGLVGGGDYMGFGKK